MLSTINEKSTRAYVHVSSRLTVRNESGQATAEFATVVLCAIALALAVAMLFTKGRFDDILAGLVEKALKVATNSVHT